MFPSTDNTCNYILEAKTVTAERYLNKNTLRHMTIKIIKNIHRILNVA